MSATTWGRTTQLTEEQQHIQRLARQFAMDEVLPLANELDPIGGKIPPTLIQRMGEVGFFAIMTSVEDGGLGLGALEYILVTEELARAWMSVSSIIRSSMLPRGLSVEKRAKYMHRAVMGEYLGAFSLSEPDTGSDAASITCRAVLDGSEWVINGAKMWCTNADRADYIVVFARTSAPPTEDKRHLGISAFFVEKEPGGFPSGIHAAAARKIGYTGWDTFELVFDNFRVPADALLGDEGKGFYAGMSSLELARVHTAARAVGLASAALEDAVTFAQRRLQFGHPISEFQALRFKIGDMAAQIEAARQLTYAAARAIDAGEKCGALASAAKYIASEMAEKVTSEGLQIHGGAGYTTDFAAQRYWREARLTKIFEGTSEIQLKILSDDVLGKAPGTGR
ncbi:butyryl-CoA dehydrogenase [Nocardioides ginsengisegetis]|uniref:Butyryl-CoA dehydrogenase n=1 Tax=Nocardioides ginsengisegetis TaxID=661491 RepID=A0A7W3P978_9ACTN|nr:acyl-CoA dehydrogenase family protein [Nocardioides ginsengisegetis]MBA8803263.1 butyryl-CoA dehydrogenase [Nocardioides ginsengisegetis]